MNYLVEKRSRETLEICLGGERAVRLREVREYVQYGFLPPRPVDRPFDHWERDAFYGTVKPNPFIFFKTK